MKPSADRTQKLVRMPDDLAQRLKSKAEELGTSVNEFIVSSISSAVDSGNASITDARSDLVIAAIGGEIGALKGIAQHFVNLGKVNLASLLYWGAAEVVADNDRKLASKELVRTAGQIARQDRALSIALLNAALRHNSENEVAKNHLGQLLYFEKDYKGAVKQLASVKDRDNRAKLFHGWASLHIAREADNRSAATRARDDIVAALEAWAFGNHDNRVRNTWLRQVAQLDALGSEYRQTVDELLDYANDNTSWAAVSRTDLTSSTAASLADDLEQLATG